MPISRPETRIGDRKIGEAYSPFTIAEVGINHNGDLNRVFEMIQVAKDSRADAVKFQTFKADEFCGDPNQTYTYKSQGKEVTESMLEMFRRVEISPKDWVAIKQKCDDVGITFLSTPQNRSDLDLLLGLDIPAIKVGSDDFTNIPLIKDYATTKIPIILSCGMAELEEVKTSLTAVGHFENYPVVLLLCTSQYPTPPKDVNLKKLQTLRKEFPSLVLGFSDHTQGALAASMAVGYGAAVFEKHFTLDHNLPGPDHWFAEEPAELKAWVSSIQTAYEVLGSSEVQPTEEEKKMRVLARRSIVALTDISEGAAFNSDNIGLRRPGNGLSPVLFEEVLGAKALHSIKKGSLLKKEDFS